MTDVFSPAGELITIFPDHEFAELIGYEPTSREFAVMMQFGPQRAGILNALWRHGTIRDKSGFAAGQLAERARRLEPTITNVSNILATPPMLACVERVINGKRTSHIQLTVLPERWLAAMQHPVSNTAEPADEGAVIDVDQPKIEPDPGVQIEIANAVATALLARVVEVIKLGDQPPAPRLEQLESDVKALEHRLGEQVGYVEKLRRELRTAQDEVIAAHHERDGLRDRLRAAEFNLKAATSLDAQRIIDEEVRKQVDRMMRQKPNSTKGPDEVPLRIAKTG